MANLIFLPIASQIGNTTYLVYDGACGTGGMLTVAEETLCKLAKQHKKEVSIHLYGQEINPETYAICNTNSLIPSNRSTTPLRTLEEIRADILALEQETEGLLSNSKFGK